MLTADDVVYMIVTDRFRDGDAGNNAYVNKGDPEARHGGDLAGVLEKLDYLVDLGVTAVWITPVYPNPPGGYHGYHPLDFESVDPGLCSASLGPTGSRQCVAEFVRRVHARGLKVVLDVVVSHTAPGHRWLRERPSWINWSGETAAKRWFRNLPSLNHDNVDVNTYFIGNVMRWVDETGVDAIRIDAARHVEEQYWLLAKLYMHARRPDLTVIGEFWDGDPAAVAPFQNVHGFDSMFDFPFYHALRDVLVEGRGFERLARAGLWEGESPGVLDLDGLYRNAYRLVTFVGNHDTVRLATALGIEAEPETAMLRLRQAAALLLTSRGIPQIYYGDELGLAGGEDPDNRRDMPWHLLEGTAANGAGERGRSLHRWVRELIALRRGSLALRYGLQVTLFVSGPVYAFARVLPDEVAVVAFNAQPTATTLRVPLAMNSRLPTVVRSVLLGDGTVLRDDLNGHAPVPVVCGEVVVELPAWGVRVMHAPRRG